MARSSLKLASYNDSVVSVMVRGVDGNILFWNRAAERQYGYSRNEALGRISHRLLGTVFPCPLDEINNHLITKGYWEGELIHNLSDGSRVKVASRWVLKAESDVSQPAVVETNKPVEVLKPESAYLNRPGSRYQKLCHFLIANWIWWVTPIVAILFFVWMVIEFGADLPLTPITQ